VNSFEVSCTQVVEQQTELFAADCSSDVSKARESERTTLHGRHQNLLRRLIDYRLNRAEHIAMVSYRLKDGETIGSSLAASQWIGGREGCCGVIKRHGGRLIGTAEVPQKAD